MVKKKEKHPLDARLLKKKIEGKEVSIFRVLEVEQEKALVIDGISAFMPKWIEINEIEEYEICTEEELQERTHVFLPDISSLHADALKLMHQRYNMIAGIVPFVSDEKMRSALIEQASAHFGFSKQSIRHYLCLYLIYQDMAVLAPQEKKEKALTQEEKNMRWALNKFYYNQNRNTLKTAYHLMLKEKYTDGEGKLLDSYPKYHQFRYFYSKTRKMQTYYIARDGVKDYQRNHRPLIGNGVQEFANMAGYGMLDATICDIYLVNEAKQIVGRPVLTFCVDGFSGLIMGYSLTWEGGMYSLRDMLLNVITDKKEHCKRFGIDITEEWNCYQMPSVLVTDRGSEYASETMEQLGDLGVSIVNLSSFRPELKSQVEKAFDVIQGYYKPYLKGKGVIESDFLERGKHDYRRDASLTMEQFETVLLHCILFYNSKRILEEFPYTEEMLEDGVKPYPNQIWKWCCENGRCNVIEVEKEQLVKVLLPRTNGVFTRSGLQVGKLHYHNPFYMEKYLQKRKERVMVAYHPDDVGEVWLIEHGAYSSFALIEKRYLEKSMEEVERMQNRQKALTKKERAVRLQGELDLAEHILTVRKQTESETASPANVKNIRKTRKKERSKAHKDFVKEVTVNG